MGKILQERIKQTKFESTRQEALLNLLVAAGFIRQKVDTACSQYGVTASQYNMLRILKGAHPKGYCRYEITDRMLEPAPDVTRLIDRLVKQELVERGESEDDRRLSIAKITPKGLELLIEMHKLVSNLDNQILLKNLTNEDCKELSRLCEQIYSANK